MEKRDTHSILCRNSPFGSLNFFTLSADEDANACLEKNSRSLLTTTDNSRRKNIMVQEISDNYSWVLEKECKLANIGSGSN